MDPMAERLKKLREERLAREKARIEKLKELNIKKYGKPNDPIKKSTSNISLIQKSVNSDTTRPKPSESARINSNVNCTMKKPISAPITNKPLKDVVKPKTIINNVKIENKCINIDSKKSIANKTISSEVKSVNIADKKLSSTSTATHKKLLNGTAISKVASDKVTYNRRVTTNSMSNTDKKPEVTCNNRKSVVNNNKFKSIEMTEKSKMNKSTKNTSKSMTANNSVFERLYKPKVTVTTHVSEVEKLRNDPNYLKKVIQSTGLILNKRHTVFDTKPKTDIPVRRSISAVHFKRISKKELGNCIHKWSSIGDKLNNIHIKHRDEDETVKADKVISAVKSEHKKVKFMTPVPNLNTPKPEELQTRLKAWLQKRGKSLDSYHHLQCFGIHHLPNSICFDTKPYDDENKENIALESDSDNDSYTENMNGDESNTENVNKWRTASIVSDSVDFNESQNTTSTYSDALNIDEVVIGALNDLTELLREGFSWEQCARWLRAIRERFPSAINAAAYWECRAALEETRGDLPASVQCWEEAIAKGTEQSVVEANLDQLLDKFMQLKISPNSGKSRRQVDPKLVDVKNVFKSTIIRFAVQQAKLRQSNQLSPAPKFSVTPVRRSARLSTHWSGRRTPLQICSSVRQAGQLIGEKLHFVPNNNLHGTP